MKSAQEPLDILFRVGVLPQKQTEGESPRSTSSGATMATSISEIRIHEESKIQRKSETWNAKVRELSQRGVSLEDLLMFYMQLGTEDGPMQHFDPHRSTTNDVVRSAIIPESKEGACALATKINEGKPKMPQKIVTHHWENRFSHTLAAIVADALDEMTYASIVERLLCRNSVEHLIEELASKGKLGLTYWVCAMSVNQHCSICGGFAPGRTEMDTVAGIAFPLCDCRLDKCFVGDACEMNKFNEMMALLCKEVPGFGQVVAIDEAFGILFRAWCVAELVEAHKQGMPQALKLHSVKNLRAHRSLLNHLDVRHCKSSRPEDKDAILAQIPDIDVFNINLRELLLNRHSGLLHVVFQKVAGYAFSWDSFSEEYLVKWEAHQQHMVPLPTVAIIPPLFALIFCTFPFKPPNLGGQDQLFWWCLGAPLSSFCAYQMFPTFIVECSGMSLNAAVRLRLLTWACCNALIFTASLGIAAALDIFPAPFTPIWGASTVTVLLPLVGGCAPKHQRSNTAFKWRFVYSALGAYAVALIFGMAFPLLNAWLKSVSVAWQALLLMLFLASKLGFEHTGLLLSRRIGADPMPCFVFFGSLCYEVNVCLVFCGGFDWLIFVELLAFDLGENVFHLWYLFRQKDSLSSDKGKRSYIVSALIIREFVELIVPMQFLVLITMVRSVQPRFNDLLCNMSAEEFSRVQLFLLVDIFIEIAICSSTYALLRTQGYFPLSMLRGFISMHFGTMLSLAIAAFVYFMALQHSHMGLDLSFKFLWIQSHGADWNCGLDWTVSD